MNEASKNFNPHLSVDCVIFGFTGDQLKVLLVERNGSTSKSRKINKYKLPGDLIHIKEDLTGAAERILYELTGLKNIFLHQFSVFGNPDRMSNDDDRYWLEETSGVSINRVVTTAYFSLISIDNSNSKNEINNNATWHDIANLPQLTFDHSDIIIAGLESLRKEIRYEPICFELLPEQFTIREIQILYEVILGQQLDNRNFRKKLLKAEYIEPLNIRQKGVAHKPAMYYRFNKEIYQTRNKEQSYYNF